MTKFERAIEKARKTIKEIAKEHNVDETKVVWMGNNKFIIVKDGQEIRTTI